MKHGFIIVYVVVIYGVMKAEPSHSTFGRGLKNLVFSINIPRPPPPVHHNSTYGTLSTTDLTFCSPSIAPSLTWSFYPNLCDSDYFPIVLTFDKFTLRQSKYPPHRWLPHKANWTLFTDLTTDTSSLL